MNNQERLIIHQQVFSKLHTAMICMNNERIKDILDLIRHWSFADNGQNGMASDAEIKREKDFYLKKLQEI